MHPVRKTGVIQNRGDLGKLRGEILRKARHLCGNLPHGETDFYPLLAKVGKAEPSPWR